VRGLEERRCGFGGERHVKGSRNGGARENRRRDVAGSEVLRVRRSCVAGCGFGGTARLREVSASKR
jgi:ribosomal protein L37E